jgi:hypothetical protein
VTDAVLPTEESPLLHHEQEHPHPQGTRARSDSTGLPGSYRRRQRRESSGLDPLTRIITGEDDTPDSNPWLHNAVSLAAVWVVGAAGWFVSYKMGAWDVADGGGGGGPSVPDDGELVPVEPVALVGMVLGYFSAVCYLW